MSTQIKVRAWLWAVLAVVIVGSGLYYYFGIYKGIKGGSSISTASPTPEKSAAVSPSATANKTATPTSGTTTSNNNGGNTTANPNLVSFNYNPTDSQWPTAIKVTFDSLGYNFDSNDLILKNNGKNLAAFSPDYSYYPSTDVVATARADAIGYQRLGSISTYESPVVITVSGFNAASYKWTKDSTQGISVIVSVYPQAQKAFKITGYFNNISESDFNKILQSIQIQK